MDTFCGVKKMQVYTRKVNWDVTYYLNVILGQKKKFFRAIICSLLIMGKNIQDFQDDANIQAFV
jgi:hypothetical protein